MRLSVDPLLLIRNAARVTALHATADFRFPIVPGLSLFLMEQKFNMDWLGGIPTSAVLLGYIAALCGRHHVSLP